MTDEGTVDVTDEPIVVESPPLVIPPEPFEHYIAFEHGEQIAEGDTPLPDDIRTRATEIRWTNPSKDPKPIPSVPSPPEPPENAESAPYVPAPAVSDVPNYPRYEPPVPEPNSLAAQALLESDSTHPVVKQLKRLVARKKK